MNSDDYFTKMLFRSQKNIDMHNVKYLSVDKMCNSLSRNSLNIWGHVEDRCTCNLVKNSCKACVAVGPTWTKQDGTEESESVRKFFYKHVCVFQEVDMIPVSCAGWCRVGFLQTRSVQARARAWDQTPSAGPSSPVHPSHC